MKTQNILLIAISVLTLTACSADHSTVESAVLASGVVAPEKVQAYQATLYAWGQAQNCTKCHADKVNPLWMNANIDTAYRLARPLVDMNNPSASLFATFASNNHCLDPICAAPASKAVVQDLLAQWAGVENTGGDAPPPPSGSGTTLPNPPYYTVSLPIPNPLPVVTAAGAPAVLRFNLSQLTPAVPALNGVIIEVSVQSYNLAQSNYKVFNPRLVGNSTPTIIGSIHAYVRPASGTGLGVEDVNQGLQWSGLTVTAPVVATPSPLPTGPMTTVKPFINTSLAIQAQSSADVLTLGFSVIH